MNNNALFLTTATCFALAGCASTAPATIADTTARTPNLSALNKLIADADLTQTLRGPGPYTVFAPSDDAFKAVPAKTLEALAKDREQLKAVLMYHVVPGKAMAADLGAGKTKTSQGAEVVVAKAGGFLTVEEALVTRADVPASNGVVHVIDRVLMPPKAKK